MKIANLDIPNERINDFCIKNHIQKLSVFGSVLDRKKEVNDIDLLVEFDSSYIPGLFKLVQMETSLSLLFNNRKIDLRTPQDLSRYFRDEVLSNAEIIYDEK